MDQQLPADRPWRRALRKACYGVYRYVDNLTRMPVEAVTWRIFNRVLTPKYYKVERRFFPRRQPSVRTWNKALQGGDLLETAQRWLAGTSAPSFYTDGVDLTHLADLAKRHDPVGVEATIALADKYCAGQFQLLEAKPSVDVDLSHVNWQLNPLDDIEWPHALNRFRRYSRCLSRAYLYTGKQQYADVLLGLMEDWIDQNPVGTPIAWASMATSLRLIEWTWALHLLRQCPSLHAKRLAKIWGSMLLQARYLLAHPEIELSDNHLIYNLGSLTIAGATFPFLLSSSQRRWVESEYLHQLRRQHRTDGMNAEQSTHYFMQVARLYIETHWLHKLLGRSDRETEQYAEAFVGDILGMIRPDGTIPLLSDAFTSFFEESGTADAHVLLGWAAVAQERPDAKFVTGRLREGAVWLLGREADRYDQIGAVQPESSSLWLRESGYYFERESWARDSSYCCVDAGPLGFPPVPAHGHPDLLSFEWYWRGIPVIVDPGTYEYEPGEWAYYFRRTRAHATVTVDKQDQATQWGFARWVDLPQFRVSAVGRGDGAFWLDGCHGGYARLSAPVAVRRRIAFLFPDIVVVEDILTGNGTHLIEQTFPLHPRWSCQVVDAGFVMRSGSEELGLTTLITPAQVELDAPRGQTQPTVWGFFASNYGVCEPSHVAVVRMRAAVPARLVTVLGPVRKPTGEGSDRFEFMGSDRRVYRVQADPNDGFVVSETMPDGRPGRALATHAHLLATSRSQASQSHWVFRNRNE